MWRPSLFLAITLCVTHLVTATGTSSTETSSPATESPETESTGTGTAYNASTLVQEVAVELNSTIVQRFLDCLEATGKNYTFSVLANEHLIVLPATNETTIDQDGEDSAMQECVDYYSEYINLLVAPEGMEDGWSNEVVEQRALDYAWMDAQGVKGIGMENGNGTVNVAVIAAGQLYGKRRSEKRCAYSKHWNYIRCGTKKCGDAKSHVVVTNDRIVYSEGAKATKCGNLDSCHKLRCWIWPHHYNTQGVLTRSVLAGRVTDCLERTNFSGKGKYFGGEL